MPHLQRRRPQISLGVAMIVVACMAIAIVWTKYFVLETFRYYEEVQFSWQSRIHAWVRFAYPSLVMGGLAILLSHLATSPPRCRMRRLIRQPGLLTCAMTASLAAIVLASIFLGKLANWTWRWLNVTKNDEMTGRFHLYPPPPGALFDATYSFHNMGFLVITGWLLLFLARTGRPKSNWPDRLGRCLGSLWIICFVVVQMIDAI